MNCFEWQNCSSDFLDGTLSETLKREADDHLETCKECTELCKRYRIILSSLASQPRLPLPPAIKKSPLSAVLPRAELAKMSISRWERIPWYLRTLIEAVGIVLTILIGITSAPKLRTLYEKSLEHGINDFRENLNVTESGADSGADIAMNDPSIPAMQKGQSADRNADGEELNGEDDAQDKVRVGRSELWRFTLKTVSPDELRPQVVRALTELKIPADTPGLGGNQVPGGIEFDMILPQGMVANVKHAMQKLTPKSSESDHPEDNSDNFSWYKVKSKKKVPDGKSQVVIWLAQPNN